ncbi:uncharacterized protein LOC120292953 [Eucalyptus grandis]|uniref:uncharacterized protein LOC120292953 n=1 Tax=Eucalyptus grandis TaxID=71139 RepID=UPI00192EE114|nr:uncharacterized protein LOC120292953 [Eucalyptus grandis]
MGNDAVTVSSGDDQEKAVPMWLRPIASVKFHGPCDIHLSEKLDFYCRVCMIAVCKGCKKQHDLFEHEMIRVYKVAKDAFFKMKDLKSLWDISDIRPHTINENAVAFVHKRGDGIPRPYDLNSDVKCETCHFRLRSSGAKFCSVECKVEAVMKMNGSESMKNEAKRKVETISEGSASNVQSFRKRPRQ